MSMQGKSVNNDNVSKISFIYPRYESPFIVSINPNYSQWMDRYCTQWAVDNCGPMAQCSRLKNKIERSDCGLFAAVTYPTANWHRCQTLMKWSIIFFICDDYHDLTSESNGGQLSVKPFWHQIYEVLDGLVEGQYHNSSEWPLFVRAVQQILREIYFDFSKNQIKRSVKMIRDYINGNVKENQWTDRRQPLPDWDTYWSARYWIVI